MKLPIAVLVGFVITCGCSSRDRKVAAPDTEIPSADTHRTAAADRHTTELAEPAHDQPPRAHASRTEQVAGATDDGSCPMMLRGVSVRTEETSDGIALEFDAPAAQLQELRARVERLSAVYDGPVALTSDAGERLDLEYSMTTDLTLDGARILFTATDPATLDQLRHEIRRHADLMRSTNTCPVASGVAPAE